MKSQTATEYIVILAVVIGLTLIVVFLVSNQQSFSGVKDAQLLILPVGVSDYVVGPWYTTMTLQNNNNEFITIYNMSFDNETCYFNPATIPLRAGERQQVNCYGVVVNRTASTFAFDFTILYEKNNQNYTVISPVAGKVANEQERMLTIFLPNGTDSYFSIWNDSLPTFNELNAIEYFSTSSISFSSANVIYFFNNSLYSADALYPPPQGYTSTSTYYYYNGTSFGGPGWRSVGGGISTIRDDDLLARFFVARTSNHAFTWTIPSYIQYWGSTPQNSQPRPWDEG